MTDISKVVDAAVEEFWAKFVYDPPGEEGVYGGTLLRPYELKTPQGGISEAEDWLRTTLTDITEKAVASERARLREGVEGMKYPEIQHDDGSTTYPTFDPSDPNKDPLYMQHAHNAALSQVLALLQPTPTPKTSCCRWCSGDVQTRNCNKCPCHKQLAAGLPNNH
jgi:hypothetical protein